MMQAKPSNSFALPKQLPTKKPDSLRLPYAYAVISVAFSVYAMVFLGTPLVALFLALWLPHAVYKRRSSIKISKSILFPVLVAALAVCSTIWSAHRDVTMRSSLEYASLLACMVIMARTVTTECFIKGLGLGTLATLVLVIFSVGGLHEDAALVGSLGSKNQVGSISEICIFCSGMSWFLYKSWLKKATFSVLPIILGTFCLLYSRSTTALISMIGAIGISYLAFLLGRLPEKLRMPTFVISIFVFSIIALAGSTFDWQSAGLKAVGKDSTLTGRTYLWGEGINKGLENPVLGVGLGAFWVQGDIEPEKLWYKFGVASRMGFHFHNLFINLFVELGLVGCILWAVMYFSTAINSIRHVLLDGANVESIFFAGISWLYVIRAFTEVDMTGPFNFAPLVFFYVVIGVATRNAIVRPSIPPRNMLTAKSLAQISYHPSKAGAP